MARTEYRIELIFCKEKRTEGTQKGFTSPNFRRESPSRMAGLVGHKVTFGSDGAILWSSYAG